MNAPRAAILTLFFAAVADGQDAAPAVGQRVVTKQSAPLMDADKVVDDGTVFRVYTVRGVAGNWLLLAADGVSGYVPAEAVVPYDRALDYFTDAIRARPTSRAYGKRGLLRKERREYEQAIADYSEAIRLEPNLASAHTNRGLVWNALGKYDRAIADYDEAIRLDPKSAVTYSNRANSWFEKRSYDKAIADGNEAIRLAPKYPAGYINRGNARLLQNDVAGALRDCDAAAGLSPDDPKVFSNRGFARECARDQVGALADYTRAVRLDPNSRTGHARRAWIMATSPDARLRDGKSAVESATRASELTGWEDADALATLAAAHAEAGDFARAVEFQEKANAKHADPKDKETGQARLTLYRGKSPYRDAG